MSSKRWFGLLLFANTASITGTAVVLVALPLFVLASGGSGTETGLVAAAETAGLALAATLGGPVIDRLGARATAVWSDLVAAAVVGAIPLVIGSEARLWPLVACGALFGLTRAPGQTARQVLVARIVPGSGIPMERANSGTEGAARLGRMVGAAVSGVLVALLGAPAVLVVGAACFVGAGLLIAGVRAPHLPAPPRTGYLREIADGLRYLGRDRLIGAIVLVVMVTNLLDAALGSVLLPMYADQVLHSSAALGVMIGVFAGGALAGSAIFAWCGPKLPRWATYTTVMLIGGAPRLLVLAAEPGLPVIVVVMAVAGIAFGAVNPLLFSVSYERIPDALLSRVMSSISACVLVGAPLGALFGGAVADLVGVRTAVLLTGLVYLVVTLCPLVFPAWRGLDRPRPAARDLVAVSG